MQPFSLPDRLSKLTSEYTWKRITLGQSQSATFLLQGRSAKRYLKIQALTAVESLSNEKDRLMWLQGKLPVPEVIYYDRDEANEYLLMTEIEGIVACAKSFEARLPELFKQLAEGLRAIHEVNIRDCPFQQSLAVKLEEARKRTELGLVNEDDFDEERLGQKAETVFEELLLLKPESEDAVFTHGDYCLPNVIMKEGRISGFIDWGRAGVADRYQDLALAVRSMNYNFGSEHIPRFLEEYGVSDLDESKIRYYQLLDEFF